MFTCKGSVLTLKCSKLYFKIIKNKIMFLQKNPSGNNRKGKRLKPVGLYSFQDITNINKIPVLNSMLS